jgi:hypothetical protein
MIRLAQGDISGMPLATRVVFLRDLDIREDSEGNQEWMWGKKTYGPQRLEDAPVPRITELMMVHNDDYNGAEGLTLWIYVHQRPLEKGLVAFQVEPCVDLRVIDDDYLLLSGTFDVYGVTTQENLSLRFNQEALNDLKSMHEEADSVFYVRHPAKLSVLLHRRWLPDGESVMHSWPHQFNNREPVLIRRKSSLSAEFSSYFHDKIVDPEDGTILCSQMVSETMSLDEMEHWLLEQLKPSEPQRFTRKNLWKLELETQVDYQDEIRLDDLDIDSIKGVVFGSLEEVSSLDWEPKKRETLFDYCHFDEASKEPLIHFIDDVVLERQGKKLNVKSGMYCFNLEAHTNLNPINYTVKLTEVLREIKVSHLRSRISASKKVESKGPMVKTNHNRRLGTNSGQNYQVGLNKSTRRLN